MKEMNLNNNEDLTQLERGDYQTPHKFALKVCNYIKENMDIKPGVIIEPTCGLGNFIDASINTFENIKCIYGIEIDKEYFNEVSLKFEDKLKCKIKLFNDNIFNFNFNLIKNDIDNDDEILVIGNPPWVTNSQLESIDSTNLPYKDNFKKLGGFDALTGKSNFDISEYIILKLIENFQNTNATIAMLCKNTVVRNIVRDVSNLNYCINNIEMISFDAKEVFNISCDASLLVFKISNKLEAKCNVYDIDKERKILRSFGWDNKNNSFVSDIDEYNQISQIDGQCILEWRQGIKHDCSKIMQLTNKDGKYINGNNEQLEIEDTYVYPMLKSSDIKNSVINSSRKYVIVTQRKVGENTSIISEKSPKLWDYLIKNSEFLDKRKSSIYKKAPRFAIFGVGDYSFAKYKVCISGFYKEPKFALAYREDGRPIMLDDTCYFLSFNDFKEALITTILLNSKLVNSFLKSIAFLDSKRPYTKEILKRIDIEKVYFCISYEEFIEIKNKLEVDYTITETEYANYKQSISNSKQMHFEVASTSDKE